MGDWLASALSPEPTHTSRSVQARSMAAGGATHVFECGPGKVLGPLSKRIVAGLEGMALADRAGIDAGLALFGKL